MTTVDTFPRRVEMALRAIFSRLGLTFLLLAAMTGGREAQGRPALPRAESPTSSTGRVAQKTTKTKKRLRKKRKAPVHPGASSPAQAADKSRGTNENGGSKAATASSTSAPPISMPVEMDVPDDIAEWSRPVTAEESVASILTRAKNLYQALEYDRVVPLAATVLQRPGLSLDERLEAHLLQGTSLAIVGDPIEAEKAFRLLLRARPDFAMAKDTPPKILAVFRKVEAEENEMQRLLEEALRKKLIASLELSGGVEGKMTGGFPVLFRYRLRDPMGAVDAVSVQYRRAGAPDYSTLALLQRSNGEWVGLIPGDWTADETGFTLEYGVITRDEKDTLLTQGTESPMQLQIARGSDADAIPPPLPVWGFATAAATTGVLAALSAGLAISVQLTQLEFNDLVTTAATTPVDGARLLSVIDRGNQLTVVQWGAIGVTGLAAVSLGAMAPFVNWTGEQAFDASAWLEVPPAE